MNTFSDFLITQWLWSVTWGVYHVPLVLILMMVLFKKMGRLRWLPTLIFSISSLLFALFTYGFVVAWLVPEVPLDYAAAQNSIEVPSSWWASMYLGVIYAVLQTLFLLFISLFYTVNRPRLIVIVALSNFLAAIAAYLLVPAL